MPFVGHYTFGSSAFASVGPVFWNSLPEYFSDPAVDVEHDQFSPDLKAFFVLM